MMDLTEYQVNWLTQQTEIRCISVSGYSGIRLGHLVVFPVNGSRKIHCRVGIPKPEKDYSEYRSYRTVSVTSCMGKRFEHVTSRRFVAILKSQIFDIYVKKLISLKHCVRSQITRLKLQKSFCDLEHGASLLWFEVTSTLCKMIGVNRNTVLEQAISLSVFRPKHHM